MTRYGGVSQRGVGDQNDRVHCTPRLAEGRSYRPHRSCEVPFSPLRQTNRIPKTDFNDFSEMRVLCMPCVRNTGTRGGSCELEP